MTTSKPRRSFGWHLKHIYVRMIFRLLPVLITLFSHLSRRIKAEMDYLPDGYSFQLKVDGTGLSCACEMIGHSRFKRIPPSRIARDVEAGSGVKSSDPKSSTIGYVISFRSLEFAFSCLSGGCTLRKALADRLFSTRGPNDTGVSLTYLFTALLGMFFGWRAAYRTAPQAR